MRTKPTTPIAQARHHRSTNSHPQMQSRRIMLAYLGHPKRNVCDKPTWRAMPTTVLPPTTALALFWHTQNHRLRTQKPYAKKPSNPTPRLKHSHLLSTAIHYSCSKPGVHQIHQASCSSFQEPARTGQTTAAPRLHGSGKLIGCAV